MQEQLPNIIFLDRNTFSDLIAFPAARLAADWHEHAHTSPGQVLAHAAEAAVVVTNNRCR